MSDQVSRALGLMLGLVTGGRPAGAADPDPGQHGPSAPGAALDADPGAGSVLLEKMLRWELVASGAWRGSAPPWWWSSAPSACSGGGRMPSGSSTGPSGPGLPAGSPAGDPGRAGCCAASCWRAPLERQTQGWGRAALEADDNPDFGRGIFMGSARGAQQVGQGLGQGRIG